MSKHIKISNIISQFIGDEPDEARIYLVDLNNDTLSNICSFMTICDLKSIQLSSKQLTNIVKLRNSKIYAFKSLSCLLHKELQKNLLIFASIDYTKVICINNDNHTFAPYPSHTLGGIFYIRWVLAKRKINCYQLTHHLFDYGVIYKIIPLLSKCTDPTILYCIISILKEVTLYNKARLSKLQIVPELINLIKNSNIDKIIECTYWTLHNIADNDYTLNQIYDTNILQHIYDKFETYCDDIQCWVLLFVLRLSETAKWKKLSFLLPIFIKICPENDSVLTMISHLLENDDNNIDNINFLLTHNYFNYLMDVFQTQYKKNIHFCYLNDLEPAIATIAFIVDNDEIIPYIDMIIDSELLEIFNYFLEANSMLTALSFVKEDILFILSQIFIKGTTKQINILLNDKTLILNIFNLCKPLNATRNIQKYAAKCVHHAVINMDKTQKEKMREYGILNILIYLLQSDGTVYFGAFILNRYLRMYCDDKIYELEDCGNFLDECRSLNISNILNNISENDNLDEHITKYVQLIKPCFDEIDESDLE